MILEDLVELKRLGNSPCPIRSKSIYKRNWLNINHKIAIPIEEFSTHYETDMDIPIYDPTGTEIGILCFTKELGEINWRGLTENQFIAFLTEANFANRESDYSFKYNYVIIGDDYFEDYRSLYEQNSSLWGGFFHLSSNTMTNYCKPVSRIDIQNLKVENEIFKENSKRAVLQPFAHERFLKLYHLLELRFDVDVIKEIQGLDFETNPEDIGRILKDYSKTEFPRLKHIIENNCVDIIPLVNRLNTINRYQNIAVDIFYKFGKDSNPFDDEVKFRAICPFGFDEASLSAQRVSFRQNHPKFITHLASYWIYRIRCCIAHNKIGEFILTHDNEEFIVEFAEPLLKEVLKQCFKP